MSKTEMIGYGILGGILGTGVVLGVAGGAMFHQHRQGGISLPMTLEMQTNASTPYTMHIMASVVRHRSHAGKDDSAKKFMATLKLEPFKAMAVGSFTAVTAMPVLPISCVPVSDAAPVNVTMYGADGKSIVQGTLAVGANGSIVLTAPTACADKDAWGLAKPAFIHYEVAEM